MKIDIHIIVSMLRLVMYSTWQLVADTHSLAGTRVTAVECCIEPELCVVAVGRFKIAVRGTRGIVDVSSCGIRQSETRCRSFTIFLCHGSVAKVSTGHQGVTGKMRVDLLVGSKKSTEGI